MRIFVQITHQQWQERTKIKQKQIDNLCYSFFHNKMSFSHLTSAKVNVGLVQELAQNELVELLEKCDGPKVNNI